MVSFNNHPSLLPPIEPNISKAFYSLIFLVFQLLLVFGPDATEAKLVKQVLVKSKVVYSDASSLRRWGPLASKYTLMSQCRQGFL